RTVNPYVAGSSPAGGAKFKKPAFIAGFLLFWTYLFPLSPLNHLKHCLSVKLASIRSHNRQSNFYCGFFFDISHR
ncbi:hypothetical protein, partial [Providencia manganoxydans]|uniref:hypothetical protein n=1 Tax=Providencia manganoxydans TaxID=2923283 RepID=UPI003B9B28E6